MMEDEIVNVIRDKSLEENIKRTIISTLKEKDTEKMVKDAIKDQLKDPAMRHMIY